VIPAGAPTAPYPNYINNFINILLNAFHSIVILQPFYCFFYKFWGPLESGGPQALLFASMKIRHWAYIRSAALRKIISLGYERCTTIIPSIGPVYILPFIILRKIIYNHRHIHVYSRIFKRGLRPKT